MSDYIAQPNTGRLHKGTREDGAECGQYTETPWSDVDAENPLEAVCIYAVNPCTKCFSRTIALHKVLLKLHSAHVIRKDLEEITKHLEWEIPEEVKNDNTRI